MELLVISSPNPLAFEAKHINDLFAAGLGCFHLRKPTYELKELTALLKEIDPRFYDRIALHQFHELATEFGIKRLHYPELARKSAEPSTLVDQEANGFVLSTSIHNIERLVQLRHFQYTFYGPVFDSISKTGYRGSLPKSFRVDKGISRAKVFALGGIQASNLNSLTTMGFDGAAVLGSLWTQPEQALSRFDELLKQLSGSNND